MLRKPIKRKEKRKTKEKSPQFAKIPREINTGKI